MTSIETSPPTMRVTPKAKHTMTKEVLTVDKDERLQSVLDFMHEKRVSKIVVAEKGAIVGVITDGDIADELGSIRNVIPFLSAIPADTSLLSANAIDSRVAPTISQRRR